jgi:hypothetical protein
MRTWPYHWFPFLFMLSSCAAIPAHGVPLIGKGLPSNFQEADGVFNARVKARFPIGSAESDLLKELETERFKVSRIERSPNSPFDHLASHEGGFGLVCNLDWNIVWTSDGGKISGLKGTYYETCP